MLRAAAVWARVEREHSRGREAVAGTYHSVPQQPVTPFQAVVAIPKGMADAAVLVPLSDLLGLSRQVTVLAYQYGGETEAGDCKPYSLIAG